MAHENDSVVFNVRCGKCHRILTPIGADLHGHDNPDDCDADSVTTPVVSPEALADFFKPKAKKKAAAKK